MFRIGLHLGARIVDGDDLYGDGVNVAARLEATGHVEVIVQAYKRGRAETPLHFPALVVAGAAVAGAEPTFPEACALDIAEWVLKWVAQDCPAAFWTGIPGDHVFRR